MAIRAQTSFLEEVVQVGSIGRPAKLKNEFLKGRCEPIYWWKEKELVVRKW